MFTISTRAQYGFLALLALAEKHEGAPVRLGFIARTLHIPFKYLENIFRLLSRAGIVRGTRGPEGGYVLQKDPRELKLYDIFQALEGPLFAVDCLEEEAALCRADEFCPVRAVWSALDATLKGFFQKRSLYAVRRRHREPVLLAHMGANKNKKQQLGRKTAV